MLLEFGGYNFVSFKEGFEVNLRLGAGCPEELKNGKDYATLLAIKGANASGKTNVLKAISFLAHFCKNSFNYKPEDRIPIDSFFNNKADTVLFAVFGDDNNEYRYEVSLNDRFVSNEKLFINDKLAIDRNETNFEVLDENYKELSVIKLRSNASFVSIANQYDLESISTFFSFFQDIFSNVAYDGLRTEMIDYKKVSKLYHEDPISLDFTKEILRKADTGITDIVIIEDEDDETQEIKYFPVFTYDVESISKEPLLLTYDKQSSGVKALYKYLAAYRGALESGGILILDELDINLHPDIMAKIIELFSNSEINKKNAQLIFTTHNEHIMDSLKKYRLIFVNKEDNESYLYRLDELGKIIRNDRSIMPLYSSGKLGAKPKIEQFNI